MSNENTTPPEDNYFKVKFRNFLGYTLGTKENFPLEFEDALLIKHTMNQQAVHIQMEDIDSNKSLLHPLMWNKKAWMEDIQRRARIKRESELRRVAVDKNRENIQSICKFLMKKYSLPNALATQIAGDVVSKGDVGILESLLGVKIESLTLEEQQVIGEYWRRL